MDRRPAALNAALARAGVDPGGAVERASVDPSRVELSEWNRLGVDPEKARRYASDWGPSVPRVLLVRRGAMYEVVDGAHRVEAARIAGDEVSALVIGPGTYEHIMNFGDTAMYEWAHEMA